MHRRIKLSTPGFIIPTHPPSTQWMAPNEVVNLKRKQAKRKKKQSNSEIRTSREKRRWLCRYYLTRIYSHFREIHQAERCDNKATETKKSAPFWRRMKTSRMPKGKKATSRLGFTYRLHDFFNMHGIIA